MCRLRLSTVHFQNWNKDSARHVCPLTCNLSLGYRLQVLPESKAIEQTENTSHVISVPPESSPSHLVAIFRLFHLFQNSTRNDCTVNFTFSTWFALQIIDKPFSLVRHLSALLLNSLVQASVTCVLVETSDLHAPHGAVCRDFYANEWHCRVRPRTFLAKRGRHEISLCSPKEKFRDANSVFT